MRKRFWILLLLLSVMVGGIVGVTQARWSVSTVSSNHATLAHMRRTITHEKTTILDVVDPYDRPSYKLFNEDIVDRMVADLINNGKTSTYVTITERTDGYFMGATPDGYRSKERVKLQDSRLRDIMRPVAYKVDSPEQCSATPPKEANPGFNMQLDSNPYNIGPSGDDTRIVCYGITMDLSGDKRHSDTVRAEGTVDVSGETAHADDKLELNGLHHAPLSEKDAAHIKDWLNNISFDTFKNSDSSLYYNKSNIDFFNEKPTIVRTPPKNHIMDGFDKPITPPVVED